MKKKLILSFCFMMLFIFIPNVYAEDLVGRNVIAHDVYLRVGPSALTDKVFTTAIPTGTVLTIKEVATESPVDSASCDSDTWYKVNYNNQDGYVCSGYAYLVAVAGSVSTDSTYDFETELAKFPESYKSKLRTLHSNHPSWEFYADDVGLDFSTVVVAESDSNKSLISVNKRENYSWLWLDSSNYDWRTDTPKQYGSWKIPSHQVIAYYIDSRNYLDDTHVFAFLTNSFKNQTEDGVKAILSGTFMSGNYDNNGTSKSYSSTFFEVGYQFNVSPYMLASRSKQEVTSSGAPSASVTGTYGNYAGYYNFYNIGATGDYDAVTNGLIWAKEHDWNTRYKAIFGGASFLATKYISRGQNNLYYQKFDVVSNKYNSDYSNYTNQYMQNVEATMSEAASTYKAYDEMINQRLVFNIPIYSNMYDTSLPGIWDAAGSGNPNNWLTNVKINGTSINGFDGDSSQEYTYKVAYDTSLINISVDKPTQGGSGSVPSTVSGDGDISISLSEGVTTPIRHVIKVTAQNGDVRNYIINITRDAEPEKDENGNIIYPTFSNVLSKISIKNSENFVYGYHFETTYTSFFNEVYKNVSLATVEVKSSPNNKTDHFATGDTISITINNNTSNYDYVLYGDLNGDGDISLADLVNCRKILLKSSNLSGSSLKASDINHDGTTNLADLVLIRKNLLGSSISQG